VFTESLPSNGPICHNIISNKSNFASKNMVVFKAMRYELNGVWGGSQSLGFIAPNYSKRGY
jgi:hypothetical protein